MQAPTYELVQAPGMPTNRCVLEQVCARTPQALQAARPRHSLFRVQGLGFRVQGLGFRV